MVEQLVFFGVSSEMGKEMDSLCDCVSFGAAPGFLAYSFVMHEFSYFGWIAVIFLRCVWHVEISSF